MPEAPRDVDHSLPAVERVEYHLKAAKELLRAARAGDPVALARLHDAIGEPRLADAQRTIADARLVIAGEYGFPTGTRTRCERSSTRTTTWSAHASARASRCLARSLSPTCSGRGSATRSASIVNASTC